MPVPVCNKLGKSAYSRTLSLTYIIEHSPQSAKRYFPLHTKLLSVGNGKLSKQQAGIFLIGKALLRQSKLLSTKTVTDKGNDSFKLLRLFIYKHLCG